MTQKNGKCMNWNKKRVEIVRTMLSQAAESKYKQYHNLYWNECQRAPDSHQTFTQHTLFSIRSLYNFFLNFPPLWDCGEGDHRTAAHQARLAQRGLPALAALCLMTPPEMKVSQGHTTQEKDGPHGVSVTEEVVTFDTSVQARNRDLGKKIRGQLLGLFHLTWLTFPPSASSRSVFGMRAGTGKVVYLPYVAQLASPLTWAQQPACRFTNM